MRLLVVDDDPLVLESCRRILTEEHQVMLAPSAEEALRVLEAVQTLVGDAGAQTDTQAQVQVLLDLGEPNGSPASRSRSIDLLLADLMLPTRDGFSLLEEVRRRWPGLPVLAMSGYITADVEARCRLLGACGFVPKPFSPDELLTAVGEALAAHRKEAGT